MQDDLVCETKTIPEHFITMISLMNEHFSNIVVYCQPQCNLVKQ